MRIEVQQWALNKLPAETQVVNKLSIAAERRKGKEQAYLEGLLRRAPRNDHYYGKDGEFIDREDDVVVYFNVSGESKSVPLAQAGIRVKDNERWVLAGGSKYSGRSRFERVEVPIPADITVDQIAMLAYAIGEFPEKIEITTTNRDKKYPERNPITKTYQYKEIGSSVYLALIELHPECIGKPLMEIGRVLTENKRKMEKNGMSSGRTGHGI